MEESAFGLCKWLVFRGFPLWHIRCLAEPVNVSLYQAASALNANARWQEIISENLAGSTIPGFKKQDLSFAAVQAGMLMPSGTTSTANGQPVSLPSVSNHMNFSQGDIRVTDVQTDLAIQGPGFFEVQMANGS